MKTILIILFSLILSHAFAQSIIRLKTGKEIPITRLVQIKPYSAEYEKDKVLHDLPLEKIDRIIGQDGTLLYIADSSLLKPKVQSNFENRIEKENTKLLEHEESISYPRFIVEAALPGMVGYSLGMEGGLEILLNRKWSLQQEAGISLDEPGYQIRTGLKKYYHYKNDIGPRILASRTYICWEGLYKDFASHEYNFTDSSQYLKYHHAAGINIMIGKQIIYKNQLSIEYFGGMGLLYNKDSYFNILPNIRLGLRIGLFL